MGLAGEDLRFILSLICRTSHNTPWGELLSVGVFKKEQVMPFTPGW